MESLGDLLKAWPSGQDMLRLAQQKQAELMQDPLVIALREKNPNITDYAIKVNLNRVHQYVTEYRNCSQCPGLDLCPNDFTGHYTLLQTEEINGETHLIDRKVGCKKLRASQHEELVRNRIRSFYIDDKALKRQYSADEILGKDLERAKVVGSLLKYIDRTKAEGLSHKGLFLAGDFGVGKTYLMCYALQELAKSGYSGVIVYMPDFVEDLKVLMHEPAKLKETVDLMKETDLLVFDDIGAENLNPWARDHVLGAILNYRMDRKPTFYTSNYRLDNLESHFSFTNKDGEEHHKGRRLMNRVAPYVDELVITGSNKRG
ncbi:MAG: ATP-binding protein [Candidatus Pristimantibacillus lignocellulolyticus]|uniref:ATP-binding protein n=1 Tax=Candidatus Pristimantibacillus lignocellulolyticus TaxID=2994561 RepID=A0A9J6ZFX5_9BACL|nr:MAG: ATP-binding protein [Candidatus Pristimantibacillus lignocellulolyticus]